jgi:hypothetical protein
MQAQIQKDYLFPQPIFNGREFDTIFCISRFRFQRIMEDIGATGNTFYLNTVYAGKPGLVLRRGFFGHSNALYMVFHLKSLLS